MPAMAIAESRLPVQYAKLPAGGGDIAVWYFREVSTPDPSRPRLLDRVRHTLRARHMSPRTEKVRAVLQRLDGVPRLMAGLLYGAGLRVLECCRLRVQDIDFAANQNVVRGGKGDKDRVTMLPAIAKADLGRHLDLVGVQHRRDLAAGAGWVELPTALLRKYPSAGREWVFPATRVYRDRLTGQRRRHHLHESVLQRAVKAAVRRAGLPKRASPHTLREAYA
jgi:integrase